MTYEAVGGPIVTPVRVRNAIAELRAFCRDELEACRMRGRYGGDHTWDRLSVEEIGEIASRLEGYAKRIREAMNSGGL